MHQYPPYPYYMKPTLSVTERFDFSQPKPKPEPSYYDPSILSISPHSTPDSDDIHDRALLGNDSPYQFVDNIGPNDPSYDRLAMQFPSSTPPLFNTAETHYEPSPSPPPERTQRKPSTRPRHHTSCPFIDKLYSLVESPEHHGVIDWSKDGRCILFVMSDHFMANVLGPNFRSKKVDSFIRQLNGYGFRRVYVTRGCRLLTREREEVAVFTHYNFDREGSRLSLIKRSSPTSSPIPSFTYHNQSHHSEAPRIITDEDCSQSFNGKIKFRMQSIKLKSLPAPHTGLPGPAM